MKEAVGENLKYLRTKFNFTQKEISNKLDVKRGAYANYENGTREMPYPFMVKVCDIYDIELSSLFEADITKAEESFVCSLRIENTQDSDNQEISLFKNIVNNYLRMCAY